MAQQNDICVISSWNVQAPYAITSVLQSQCTDDCSYEPAITSTPSIRLAPPSTAANDDNTLPPCQLTLSCSTHYEVVSIEVVSSARHVELYDSQDSYCFTTRGTRQEVQEDDKQTNSALYSAALVLDHPAPHCRLKFVSLSDKHQLTLRRLMVTFQSTPRDSHSSSVAGRSIDMVKVREIMDSLQQPVPTNVQNLMQTVEQYQKNQASVLDDFKQAATDRLLTSSNDPKASLAANMAGMLSMFSKASSLQHAASSCHTATPAERVELGSASPTASAQNLSPGSSALSPELSTESLSKLLAAFGLQQAPVEMENVEPNESEASPDMLNTLRKMCRDVSHMRAADRQTANKSCTAESVDGRESNTEIARQRDKSSGANGMMELEQRLMRYIIGSEERIMARLHQHMNHLQQHIDYRFDKLEAIFQGQRQTASENPSPDSVFISEGVD